MTYRSGATCSCGHDVIDHDGTGCDERDCACATPVDELLAPAADAPPAPLALAARTASGARTGPTMHFPPIADVTPGQPIALVHCSVCDQWAVPHVHGRAYL